MFLFKKLVSPLLFPIPVIVVLLLIGCVQLWRTRNARKRRGFGWIVTALVVLLLLAYRPIPMFMLEQLEYQYAPVVDAPPGVRWVVVLASGVSDDPRLADAQRLAGSSTVRTVEGIRLVRQIPEGQLLLSGGSPFGSVAAAPVMRELAIGLGVPDSVITLESKSLDTKDQAVAVAEIIGRQPFLLVTSAMHMPRSMALFTKQGLAPIAAPTDFISRRSTTLHPGAFYPSSLNLRSARTAWREYLGMMWARLRGQA